LPATKAPCSQKQPAAHFQPRQIASFPIIVKHASTESSGKHRRPQHGTAWHNNSTQIYSGALAPLLQTTSADIFLLLPHRLSGYRSICICTATSTPGQQRRPQVCCTAAVFLLLPPLLPLLVLLPVFGSRLWPAAAAQALEQPHHAVEDLQHSSSTDDTGPRWALAHTMILAEPLVFACMLQLLLFTHRQPVPNV
jgi:hypothetical protein